MWSIWWARRRAIHDDQYQSPLSTSVFITKFLGDLDLMAENKLRPTKVQHVMPKELHVTADNAATKATRPVWIPPTDFDVKINVDGGVSCGRRGAAAVICRDKAGAFLGSSARVFEGLTDPPSLEAQACNEALALATDLNLNDVCVTSDCAEVISKIGTEAPCHYTSILREISYRSTHFQDIRFVHESRKYNLEAHSLAKAAVSLSNGRHVWLVTTPDIICIPMNIQI
uniref:RNase H type-1 domain-containing protein n=1 Tax=Aegilops tauschii subsp. strangulata TaxID=200361 RepID=A0A453L8H0_AEGTS